MYLFQIINPIVFFCIYFNILDTFYVVSYWFSHLKVLSFCFDLTLDQGCLLKHIFKFNFINNITKNVQNYYTTPDIKCLSSFRCTLHKHMLGCLQHCFSLQSSQNEQTILYSVLCVQWLMGWLAFQCPRETLSNDQSTGRLSDISGILQKGDKERWWSLSR